MPSSTHIVVRPATLRLSLTPGDPTKGEIEVQNLGDSTEEISFYAEPFSVDTFYQPTFNAPNRFTDIYTWIVFDHPSYIFAPGEARTIPFTINTPSTAPGGGQYAAIFADAGAINPNDTAIVTAQRIALLLYTKVAGDIQPGSTMKFIPTCWFHINQDIALREIHYNTGNIDYETTTNIILRGIFSGREHRSLTTTTRTILPETSPTLESTIEDVPLGLYAVHRSAEIFGETYSAGQLLIVVPLPFIILSALVILSALGLIIASIKKHKALSRQTPPTTTAKKDSKQA